MTGKSYSWGAAKSGQIYYLANLAQDVTGTGETATGGGGKGREGSKPPTLISTVAVVFSLQTRTMVAHLWPLCSHRALLREDWDNSVN